MTNRKSAGESAKRAATSYHDIREQPLASTGSGTVGNVIPKKLTEQTKAMDNTQNSPVADPASELGVEIEALEERLEMVGIEALACCSINVGCKSSAD